MTNEHSIPSVPEDLIAEFRADALERIERVELHWGAINHGGLDAAALAEALREVHTLKGDARGVGFVDIGFVCHKLEELLQAGAGRRDAGSDELDLVVTMAFQFMRLLLRKKAGRSLGGIDLAGFVAQIDDVLSEARAEAPAGAVTVLLRGGGGRAAELPERLSREARARLAASATEVFLESLRTTGPARDRLRAISATLSREVESLAAVPLGLRLERHAHAAAGLARDLRKEVEITLHAGEERVLLEVAEALDTAVLHVVRNAIDHGIEDASTRIRHGKSPRAMLRILASAGGDAVEVSVEDDGRGIDFEAVRRRGEDLGILPAGVTGSTREALTDLLFRSGFSTREVASDVSGRGIGLDAVRTSIERAGGSVRLAPRAEGGTIVLMRIPQVGRHVAVRWFWARKGELAIAVPAEWCPEIEMGHASAIDPLQRLGVSSDPGPDVIRLRVGGREARLQGWGPVEEASAERLCPTADDAPLEIARVGGHDALLLRAGFFAAVC